MLDAYGRTGRKVWHAVVLALAFGLSTAQAADTAESRLNQPGPENSALALRAGIWDVVETTWASADAAPVTTRGLVAERKVIGQMFQEILRVPSQDNPESIDRIDYLSFDRVEGRWKYVSMDMRSPVGIMSASSIERGDPGKIEVLFTPFAIAGSGRESTGQLIGMTQTLIYSSADADSNEQYFILADGSGKKWLGHRYDYARRK